MDKSKVSLLAACVALGGVVAWQRPFDAVSVAPPAPLQLAPASVAPAAAPAPVAAVSKKTAAAKRVVPASRPADGETPDDYVYVPPAKPRARAVVETTPTPRATAAGPATPAYERSVAEAAELGTEDLDRAARRLERITADEPARPTAYETLAAIRLQQGDFYQASEMFASAIRHGGKAAFAIMHDHTRGNFDSGPNDTCAGELALLPAGVRFEGASGHRFEASWAELLEAGANRFFGSGIGGFHVKVAVAEGKTRNFNLAPRSRDKREANLILDLLIEHAERNDRGK